MVKFKCLGCDEIPNMNVCGVCGGGITSCEIMVWM